MDFKIEKNVQNKAQVQRYNKDVLDVAYKFSKEAYKEFGSLIKAIVLFGSVAKDKTTTNSDIDILIVLDDLTVVWSKELMETYKIICEKKIATISRRLHITTLKLTTFWEYIKNGDPVGINILRDGVALVDTGFFAPLQALLARGRIRPTAESVWTYFSKAQGTLDNSRHHLIGATIDLYWACIDACHAALMRMGTIPPSPEHVAKLLDEKLVKPGHLARKHVDTMRYLYKLYKAITHRAIDDIAGNQYEKYYTSAKDLVDDIKKFIEKKL
jgi:predicted nucleotidyltransferase